MLILSIFAGLGFAGYLFRDTIAKYFDTLELELSANYVELPYGTKFVAEDYIVKATDGEDIIQIWPTFTADELGESKLQYVITNNVRAVKKYLTVKVVDNENPVIKLSDDKITLTRNVDEFNGFKYIESVTDNYDPSPKVEIGAIDWAKKNQEIVYTAIDSEGNVATAVLNVEIKNKPVVYIPTNSTSESTGDTSTSSGDSSSSSSSSGTSWSESWTVDYTDYQPSNGQTDVTYTNNDTGESYTVSDSDSGPYESDEDLWNEIDNLGN